MPHPTYVTFQVKSGIEGPTLAIARVATGNFVKPKGLFAVSIHVEGTPTKVMMSPYLENDIGAGITVMALLRLYEGLYRTGKGALAFIFADAHTRTDISPGDALTHAAPTVGELFSGITHAETTERIHIGFEWDKATGVVTPELTRFVDAPVLLARLTRYVKTLCQSLQNEYKAHGRIYDFTPRSRRRTSNRMGYRLPQHFGHVLCPSLAGEHFFAIIGAQGYAHGILARTLKGFLHTATRVAREEGFDKIVGGPPTRINIVSPSEDDFQRFTCEWDLAELDRVRGRVGWSLHALLKAGDPIPEGFEAIRKPRNGDAQRFTAHGHVIVCARLDYKRDRYFVWTGQPAFAKRFGPSFKETYPAAVEGAPSRAPAREKGTRLFFACRGFDGGCGSQPVAGVLDVRGKGFEWAHTILQTTPAFFFTVTEELPGVLDPVWRDLAEYRARVKARRLAKLAAHQARIAAEELEELNATREIFRPR